MALFGLFNNKKDFGIVDKYKSISIERVNKFLDRGIGLSTNIRSFGKLYSNLKTGLGICILTKIISKWFLCSR